MNATAASAHDLLFFINQKKPIAFGSTLGGRRNEFFKKKFQGCPISKANVRVS
jgi:hypothetical protein